MRAQHCRSSTNENAGYTSARKGAGWEGGFGLRGCGEHRTGVVLENSVSRFIFLLHMAAAMLELLEHDNHHYHHAT